MYTGPGHVLVAIAIALVVASAVSPSRGELIIEVVVASNNVWQDISSQLNNRMSINALHVFVYKGYHGIKEKLGLTQIKSQDVVLPKNTILSNLDQSSDFESSDELDSDLPNKKFVITFSADEWKEIQPHTVQYKLLDKKRPLQHSKSYEVLPKNRWTPLIAEHFWIHTQLPCCLSFRRAKVSLNGDNYVSVVGRCSVCGSYFKGIVLEKPPDNARVLMQCSYVGNFNEPHKVIKKRRMIGPVIEKALSHIVKEGMSCETYRENEAVRLMKTNDHEPSIIPTGHALRNLKRRQRLNNERDSNKLKALCMMKTENEFKSVINDIGLDPFFLCYHTGDQIHLYRNYARQSKYPQIILDATGSLVSNFRKYDMEKTKYIFLYEALVYDEENKYSFTVSNMLSERHSNVAIFNWLANWKNCDIPLPKITVCDQSLALLSAVVQCFTQYSSLQDYINVCADLIVNNLPANKHWIPRCFVRTDIAHFLKLITKWPPLKTVARRVREVILRSLCMLIKMQSLDAMFSFLLSLFIVLTNETDGNNSISGDETPCEMHKQRIIYASSTGKVDNDHLLEKLLDPENEEEIQYNVPETQETLNEALGNLNNPFQKWVERIYSESQTFLQTGNNINPLYLPELVPYIIKCMKLVPLWSGIMIPIFGYGTETASSAAVESSFNKLKNITFKNISLPTDIELFLEHHISSLRGMSLLKSGYNLSPKETNEIPENNEVNKNILPTYRNIFLNNKNTLCGGQNFSREDSPTNVVNNHSDEDSSEENITISKESLPTHLCSDINVDDSPSIKESSLNKDTLLKKINSDSNECLNTASLDNLNYIKRMPVIENYEKKIDDYIENFSKNFNSINKNKSKCPLCAAGNFPTNKHKKCAVCEVPVHTLSSCSLTSPGGTSICLTCSHDVLFVDNLAEENKSVEGWDKKLTNKKKIQSYLNLNPHLRHLQINNLKKMKTLPILKNGSRADELKSCTVEDFGKVILSNTRAFDSVSSILMVAYCDSVNYNTEVDGLENIFLKFIAGIVKNGISAKTYLTRAEIVIKYLKPRVEYLEYNTTLAVCDTTVGNVFKQLLVEFPTVLDNIQCSTSNCNKTTKCYPIPVPYITIHITDGKLNSLEEDLKKRLLIENTSCNHLDKKENKCRGLKTIQPSVSLMHLFIELLNWQEMPKFAEPITNVTAPVGREATIVCIVDDLGSYKVAWLRVDTQTILTIHNHVITKNHRIGVSHSDHRTWHIHIKEVRESDKGWYMCQINTDPMKSQLGFLDIVVPPDILDYPTSTDMNIREGSNVSLRCAASGSPAPNITWRKEGSENIRLEHSQQVHSVEGPVLNLTRISRSHMGAYLCIASNGVPPSVSKRIMLVVNFPPMIWIQNQLIGAFIGQSLTLECLSEAHPKSINYWTREAGEIIAHGEKYEPEEFVTEQYKTRMKLTIKSVTAEDYGTYKCLSRNALGDTDGTIKIYQVANNGGHSTTRPKHRYKNRNRTRIRAQSNDIRDSAFLSKDESNELQTHYDDDGELEEYDSGSQAQELALYTAILCVIALMYGHE